MSFVFHFQNIIFETFPLQSCFVVICEKFSAYWNFGLPTFPYDYINELFLQINW